ncbi:MAG TPA: VWA domain-containing protein [Pyrinomonadaceae bacterium]
MRNITLLALLTLSCFGYAAGQTPTPTPPPADETDVVKITTTLIQLDVTVTDKRGNIVTDLRPDEIEVYENGEKQKITNFSFISNARVIETAEKEKEKEAPGVALPPSRVRVEQVRRTIALVVDDLTLSFESTHFVRRALKKFVDEQMQDGDLVAIIRTGAGIGALQQFTNDKRQLHAAIERVRWNSLGAGNIGAFAPLQARAPTEDDDDPAPGERTPEGIEREFDDFRESLFATGTLGAINYVIRGMQDLPGRKSVMLLSDGFSLFTRDASGFRDSSRVLGSLRRLVDMANRASVVVYTMDARGLQYTGLTAADNTSGRSVEQIEREIANRRDRLLDTQEGLRYLARQTGGISITNNNDLSSGIRRILDDQSYYLIGYEPDEATFDPKIRRFNRLEIKVKRPGTNVRYRSGFFGISDERLNRPQQTPGERLLGALTSPFAVQDIALRLNALFYNSPKEGNIIRSLVHVRAQDIKLSDMPDGSKQAVFDVFAAGFGDNGVVIDQISKTYTMTIRKDNLQNFVKHGFVYDFAFPVKKPGAYQLRIALRDHLTDKLGSANQFVEVPNLKKDRLQLSGVVLENVTFSEWQKRDSGQPATLGPTGPLNDTSLRQFKRGTVLNYGFSIYNAKQAATSPNLSYQTRLFRDGKVVFEGKVQPVPKMPSSMPTALQYTSALALGSEMAPGDYVLQIVITDHLAKPKRNTATQFVQFEITE